MGYQGGVDPVNAICAQVKRSDTLVHVRKYAHSNSTTPLLEASQSRAA